MTTTYVSAWQELRDDFDNLLRWIDGKVGASGAIIVALSAVLIALVSFLAVNTWA